MYLPPIRPPRSTYEIGSWAFQPVLPASCLSLPFLGASSPLSSRSQRQLRVSRTRSSVAAMVVEGSIFRLWEFSKMSLAAWAVAGSIGYVLCAPRSQQIFPVRDAATAAAHRIRSVPVHADIRPKLYPRIEYERARVFTTTWRSLLGARYREQEARRGRRNPRTRERVTCRKCAKSTWASFRSSAR